MKTCAFTGHRPKGLGYPESDERCAALKEKLRSLIIRMMEEEGVTHFPMSGRQYGGRKPYETAISPSQSDATRRRCCKHTIRRTVCGSGTNIW